jgi:hypothetical protein
MDSADVFSLLGDERRLEIIVALRDAPTDTVSFSDLHDAVELADSGQFNYHLSKLVGQFVAKRPEGYELTSAGRRVARAIAAGLYTQSPEITPFAIDSQCIECGSTEMEARYTDEQFQISCTACEQVIIQVSAPPSIIRDRDPIEALDAFEQWSFMQVDAVLEHDLCPYCAGPVDRTLSQDTPNQRPIEALPRYECRVCGGSVTTSFGAIAVRDPVVSAFQERHDLVDESDYYWEVDQFVGDDALEMVSDDPWRIQITFEGDDETCRVVLDDSHRIVRTEIEQRDVDAS